MRDPARIARVIEKLRALWLSSPDLRLGQLVGHLCDGNVYAVEDDVLEQAIDAATANGWASLASRP